jgi:cyanocobalamin reductase (cyanide-eliminating) / alkylcobalamin dealkylase
VSELAWQSITERVAMAAERAGFDIVHPFNVAHYNSTAPAAQRLDDYERPDALGLLIGNTRQLWPAFTRACTADSTLQSAAQPLDTYTVTRLTAVLAAATTARVQLVFSHVTHPQAFPIQRLAERVGLTALSPSHLAIHPLHGPWLALRAVAVVDVAGPVERPPPLANPCQSCSAPCVPALERALAASGTPLSSAGVVAHAHLWIAVRDACPVGRPSRYGDTQVAYHYGISRSRILPDS